MSLTPVIYVDNETVIGAQNLNEIQDAILANEQGLANKVSTTDYNPAIKTSDMNQPVGKDSSGKLWTKLIGGAGLIIKGYYPTLQALQQAVPNPSLGDAYGVGSSAPYTIYVWSGTAWVDNGTLASVASVNNQVGVVQLDGTDINVDDDAQTPQTIKNKFVSTDNTIAEHSSQIVLQSQNLEATQDMISDAWDSTVTYTVGQYCISGNQLYKCKVQHINQQPPNATYWGAVNAGDELQLLNKFETYSATTQNISAGSVVAHKMGKIGMIKIDVTMSISSSSWTNIATFGTELTWEQSGYGLLVNTATGSSLYGQLFLNGSVPTFRVQGGISSGNGIRGTYFFI